MSRSIIRGRVWAHVSTQWSIITSRYINYIRGVIVPDLLIKDVSEEDKELLRVQAAKKGRSMQEELREIIHNGVNPTTGGGWYASLRSLLNGLEGEGFELPSRQQPRPTIDFE